MQNQRLSSNRYVSHLVVTWVLMIPLAFYAIGGVIRFNAHSRNNALEASYTSLVQSDGPEQMAHKIVFLICGLIVCTRIRGVVGMARNNIVFTALLLIALASTVWSQFPWDTFAGGMYAAMNMLFAFYIAVRFNPRRQMQLFLLLGWIIALSSIAVAVLFPQYGVDHQGAGHIGAWMGIFGQKNWCAVMVTVLLSTAFYVRPASMFLRLTRVAYIIVSLFLIVMSQSRTGWIVTGCLLLYVTVTNYVKRYRAKDALFITIFFGSAAAMAGAILAQYYAAIMQLFGRDPTLTGRTTIWSLVFVSIMKQPFLGYGFRAFWHGLEGESANVSLAYHWIVPAAHNGFLDLWLGLGAVGVGMVLLSMFQAVRNAIRCFRSGPSPSAEWYLSIVFMTGVINAAGLTLMVPDYLAWIVYIVACVGLSQEAKRIRLEMDHRLELWSSGVSSPVLQPVVP